MPDRAAPFAPGRFLVFGNEGHRFEECEHIVRDDDVDTALCGVDQTDVPWNQGFPVCQACVAVAEGRLS
jgi:hypothetical protein